MGETLNTNACFPSDAADRYVVYKGSSMHPLLHDSELLVLEHYGERLPGKGDVIVFDCPSLGYKVIHRVISVNNGTIRTQGDSNSEIDPYRLGLAAIQGRVIGVCRGGGTVMISGGSQGAILGWYLRKLNSLARWRSRFL